MEDKTEKACGLGAKYTNRCANALAEPVAGDNSHGLQGHCRLPRKAWANLLSAKHPQTPKHTEWKEKQQTKDSTTTCETRSVLLAADHLLQSLFLFFGRAVSLLLGAAEDCQARSTFSKTCALRGIREAIAIFPNLQYQPLQRIEVSCSP